MQKNANLEFWYRKVPSLEFFYEVNANGTVLRNVKSKRHLKLNKQSHNSNTQYLCCSVNIKHKIRKVYIHQIVAECWLGQRPEGMQIDHIDRNSLNNDYRNLRYVTKSEQMKNRDYSLFGDKLLDNLSIGNKGVRRIPIKLTRADGTEFFFESTRKAGQFLATIYTHKPVKSFVDKFHLRRKHIFDFDVEYQNAETRHGSLNNKGKE